jgi:restriction-modification enzyme MmeI-like protein
LAPSTEEIRHRLGEFAAKWGGYEGSERAEAQTFLTQLLACYGTDREAAGAKFEEPTGGKFMDMIWPGVCIVEMKRPGEAGKVSQHRQQALEYWQSVGQPGAPAPPYVVLCAFHRFEIWKPGEVYTEPLAEFDLTELPENCDALLFLAGRQPGFFAHDRLTRDAVALVTDLYAQLEEREAADDDVLQDFVLQVVWSLFAEDLGMLPGHLFTRLLDGLIANENRSSFDDLGRLFRYLAKKEPRPSHGVYEGTPYANGGLFAKPAEVHLEPEEIEMLRKAADFEWTEVEPAIFGSLLTGALGREKQWALGAHYTAEADILKVVIPTVIDPWRDRIASCDTLDKAKAAQRDLMEYVVLDPACGSGNFLYIAYRELRRIEAELRNQIATLRRSAGLPDQAELSLFPIQNMKGIEIEPFAAKLARVTMWIGHKLAVDKLGVDEPVLPLVNLSEIRQGDALRVPWPRANAIISNPPYHGSQRLRGELGDEYVEWLTQEFGIGIKDYAVYWFRKAHPHLADGGRAGLVVTNSVSQNRNRGPTLDWIIENGAVITNAVSKQHWSGEANVNVSIVNWIKNPMHTPRQVVLDGEEVDQITAALRTPGLDVSDAIPLQLNDGITFQGPQPVGMGFLLDIPEAEAILARSDANYVDVVRPYLVGKDITTTPNQHPTRCIIDFGTRSLEEAKEYPRALEIVRERVKPVRDENRRKVRREKWWLLGELVPAMRAALAPLTRYIAGTATGKRVIFAWADRVWCPSNAMNVFALDDDYSMGILTSRIHGEWAQPQSSTMRVDPRYTPTSAFMTFPWPAPTDAQRRKIDQITKRLMVSRQKVCVTHEVGLTKLYNEVDQGAYAELRKLHDELDRAVVKAYGWPTSVASDADEANRRLLELNAAIVAGEVAYSPFS